MSYQLLTGLGKPDPYRKEKDAVAFLSAGESIEINGVLVRREQGGLLNAAGALYRNANECVENIYAWIADEINV